MLARRGACHRRRSRASWHRRFEKGGLQGAGLRDLRSHSLLTQLVVQSSRSEGLVTSLAFSRTHLSPLYRA